MEERDIAFCQLNEYKENGNIKAVENLYASFLNVFENEIEPLISEGIAHSLSEEVSGEDVINRIVERLVEKDLEDGTLFGYLYLYNHLLTEIDTFARGNELGRVFQSYGLNPSLLRLYWFPAYTRGRSYYRDPRFRPAMMLQAISVAYVIANEVMGLCRYAERSYDVLKMAYCGSKRLQFTWADYFNYINVTHSSVLSTIMYNLVTMVLRSQRQAVASDALDEMEKKGIAFADFAYKKKNDMRANVAIQPLTKIVDGDINSLYDTATMSLQLEDAFGLKVAGFEHEGKGCLAFAGTRLDFRGAGKSIVSIQNVLTDLIQIAYKPTPAYMAAVGIVDGMLGNGSDLYVFGHSLGGGLMQFACAANSTTKVHGYGYNAAGLSAMSCDILSKNGAYVPLNNIVFVNASTDVVSKIGSFLGRRKTVETRGVDMLTAHKLETLNKKVNQPELYC